MQAFTVLWRAADLTPHACTGAADRHNGRATASLSAVTDRRSIKFASSSRRSQAFQNALPQPQPPSRTWTRAEDEAGRPAGLHPADAARWCIQRVNGAAGDGPAGGGGGGGRTGWAPAAVGPLLAAGEHLLLRHSHLSAAGWN